MGYTATIELTESQIREILAEHFEVKPEKVFFVVSRGQRDEDIVTCKIKMDVEVKNKEKQNNYRPWYYAN